jgi:hypothetical protein
VAPTSTAEPINSKVMFQVFPLADERSTGEETVRLSDERTVAPVASVTVTTTAKAPAVVGPQEMDELLAEEHPPGR